MLPYLLHLNYKQNKEFGKAWMYDCMCYVRVQCTAAAGRKVILALASDRKWKELKKTDATQLVYSLGPTTTIDNRATHRDKLYHGPKRITDCGPN